MSKKTYHFVECDGCYKEQRMDGEMPPEGHVVVNTRDGRLVWHLCLECHKEVTLFLFERVRQDRVLADRSKRAKEARS